MATHLMRAAAVAAMGAAAAINRRGVVQRHNVVFSLGATNSSVDPMDVLTVGNGCFAVGLDLLGSQTLNDTYTDTDLNALTDWLSHTQPASGPDPSAFLNDYNTTAYETPTDGAGHVRQVRYPTGSNNTGPGATWTHANPHKPNAFQLSLRRTTLGGGASAAPLTLGAVLPGTASALDLWTGTVSAAGALAGGISVHSSATVHPDLDLFAITVAVTGAVPSPDGALSLRLSFPYALGNAKPSEWSHAYDASHTTTLSSAGASAVWVARTLDDDSYSLRCEWALASGGAQFAARLQQSERHVIDLVIPEGVPSAYNISLSCLAVPWSEGGGPPYYPTGGWMPWLQNKTAESARAFTAGLPSADATAAAAAAAWAAFWTEGAFLDLASATGDPEALELERRIVLSRYLMRAHEACAAPPQETGLLLNSWSGKHHLEMRFWHQAHWALWGNADLLHRSDGYYVDALPNASATAAYQGYDGARWPKMVLPAGNRGRGGLDTPWLGLAYDAHPFPAPWSAATAAPLFQWESNSAVGPLLVWQQPHVIWLADLQRCAANSSSGPAAAAAVVAFHAPLVLQTAAFLASFPYLNASDNGGDSGGHFWMGPPLFGGEEMGDPTGIFNPTFELVYFGLMLDVANEWLELTGQPRNASWDRMAEAFARPFVDPASPPGAPLYSFNYACACAYVPAAECPAGRFGNRTQCSPLTSHPMPTGLVGMLDGLRASGRYGVSAATANNTVAATVARWGWGNATQGTNVWGWDFPLVALAQARLGWSADAVKDMLLYPALKNSYTAAGYNWAPGICAYMPGNGGVLLAAAALAGGFSSGGAPPVGFPAQWHAAAEGFTVPYP